MVDQVTVRATDVERAAGALVDVPGVHGHAIGDLDIAQRRPVLIEFIQTHRRAVAQRDNQAKGFSVVRIAIGENSGSHLDIAIAANVDIAVVSIGRPVCSIGGSFQRRAEVGTVGGRRSLGRRAIVQIHLNARACRAGHGEHGITICLAHHDVGYCDCVIGLCYIVRSHARDVAHRLITNGGNRRQAVTVN